MRVDFHLAGTICLEERERVALEGLEFEFAFGEALLQEFGLEGILLASFVRVVFEDGSGVGLEAVAGAVGCGVGATLFGFGASGLSGIESVGIDLSLC